MSSNILFAQDVTKRYGPTTALDGVTVEFVPGTVHALMGANGSGKSTLTKTLVGVVDPDGGDIRIGYDSLNRSRDRSVVAVFQETSLVPGMTVEDNIWLGREPRNIFGVDRRELRARTAALIDLVAAVAPGIRPERAVAELGPDERQLVELLKAASRSPDFIILDEATASLDARQANRVAELVNDWRALGRCVILVTHRMHEAFSLADTISVLKNGRLVATGPRSTMDEARVVDLMVGAAGSASTRSARQLAGPEAPSLSARVAIADEGHAFPLDVRQGEIVGLAGLQGQGQARVLRGLFCGDQAVSGLRVLGSPVVVRQPSEAVAAGLAFVPGDRNRDGLLKGLSVTDNVMATSWPSFGRWGLLDLRKSREAVNALIAKLKVKTASASVPVSTLSGGNAQKVVLARWLATKPKFLLLDDPTKGIDVNARADFYEALEEARDEGMGILLYSSDENELARLCDRVLVMLEGRLVATLDGDQVEAETIARAGLVGAHHA